MGLLLGFINKFFFFFILTIVIGILIHLPALDYQGLIAEGHYSGYLSQGDHGRDLYNYYQTSLGKIPYRDYWMNYGPFMPYYYAHFLKTFGTNIQSVLIGQFCLRLMSGVVVFAILAGFISPFLSFLGAFWYFLFHYDFYHTYNHDGAIFFLLVLLCFIFRFIKYRNSKWLYLSLFISFLLSLIKLNVGLASLAALLISTYTINHIDKQSSKKNYMTIYILGASLIPILIFLFYFLLLHDYSVEYM